MFLDYVVFSHLVSSISFSHSSFVSHPTIRSPLPNCFMDVIPSLSTVGLTEFFNNFSVSCSELFFGFITIKLSDPSLPLFCNTWLYLSLWFTRCILVLHDMYSCCHSCCPITTTSLFSHLSSLEMTSCYPS